MGVIFRVSGTAVGEVISISGPSYSKTAIGTTNLNLAGSAHFRTFMQGINDGGEVSLQVQFDADDGGQLLIIPAELITDVGSDLLTYKLELNDSGGTNVTSWEFTGIITKCDFGGMDIDGRITMDVTIKVSGKPTYVKGV